jgi:subtilase family serine protease
VGQNIRVASVLVAGAALLVGGSASAQTRVPRYVRVSAAPALPQGARVLGAVSPHTRLRLTVVLKSRDAGGLSRLAAAVSTPGGDAFRRYLTVGQFRQRFGAPPAAVRALRISLRARGLAPGGLSANGLSVGLVAPADRLERAFSTALIRVRLAGGRAAFVNIRGPLLSGSVAGSVQAVLGLDSLALYRPQVRARMHRGAAPERPHVVTGGPQPCATARQKSVTLGGYTADQIASAYRFPGLYGSGDLGAGQTVALLEGEPVTDSDIAAFQSCYGTHTHVVQVRVNGGSNSQQSGEAALDIETVIGFSPRARVLDYVMPQLDAPDVYDSFSEAIGQNRAQVISVSFGECERDTSPSYTAAENVLFEEAATQGQSMFAATGDFGANNCITNSGIPTSRLAVSDPASQPYVTAVGGTTLSTLGPPPHEVVWDAPARQGGSGGGISTLWRMPAYQSLTPAAVHVIGSRSSRQPCRAPRGSYCREIPDVSADANANTGYLLYFGGWTVAGGTSFSAPLWASLAALAGASGACQGKRIGFANPALYQAAAHDYPLYFNDVTQGTNSIGFGGFPAGPEYDMATGLGTPQAAALSGKLCHIGSEPRPTARISSPRDGRYFAVGQQVRTSFSCADAGGPGIYSCLDSRGARPPSGRLDTSAAGRFSYVVTATSRYGQIAAVLIRYTVARPPSASISTPRRGRHYRQGQRVATRFTCREGSFGPGLRSCRDSHGSASPGHLSTDRVGTFTYRVTAVSRDGQRGTVSVRYRVV